MKIASTDFLLTLFMKILALKKGALQGTTATLKYHYVTHYSWQEVTYHCYSYKITQLQKVIVLTKPSMLTCKFGLFFQSFKSITT